MLSPPPSRILIALSQISKRAGKHYPLSLDKWYTNFLARAAAMGVPLTEKLTQQLSAGRLMVTEASITEFVDECVIPELNQVRAAGKRFTLNDVSGLDEWWFDGNKALNGKIVGPAASRVRASRASRTHP